MAARKMTGTILIFRLMPNATPAASRTLPVEQVERQ
jgi:hypothetical protein